MGITGYVGTISRPQNVLEVAKSGGDYTSIQTAIGAATAGTLVIVYPGVYTESLLLKDLVDLCLHPGVSIVARSSQGQQAAITDGNMPVRCTIDGPGEILGANDNESFTPVGIRTGNANTILIVKAKSITNAYCEAGSQFLVADKIDHIDCLAGQSRQTVKTRELVSAIARGGVQVVNTVTCNDVQCYSDATQEIEAHTIQQVSCGGGNQAIRASYLASGPVCSSGEQFLQVTRINLPYNGSAVINQAGLQTVIADQIVAQEENFLAVQSLSTQGFQDIKARIIRGIVSCEDGQQFVETETVFGFIRTYNYNDPSKRPRQTIKAHVIYSSNDGFSPIQSYGGIQFVEAGLISGNGASVVSYFGLSGGSQLTIRSAQVVLRSLSPGVYPILRSGTEGRLVLWDCVLVCPPELDYSLTGSGGAAIIFYGTNLSNLPVPDSIVSQVGRLSVDPGVHLTFEAPTNVPVPDRPPAPPQPEPTPNPTPTPNPNLPTPAPDPAAIPGYRTETVVPLGSEGMTLIHSGSIDDGNVNIGDISFAFPFFEGSFQSDIFVGSNGYVTFGEGFNNYGSLTRTSVRKALMIAAADRSYQQVFVKQDEPGRTARIRYEGSFGLNGIVGDPSMLWEVTLFADGTVQLVTGRLDVTTGVSSLTNGDNINYTDFSVQPNTSFVFIRQSETQYAVYLGSYQLS